MLHFLNYTSPTPADDLALEEVLHLAVEDGTLPAIWRLWQPAQRAVILGTGQESAKEAHLELARATGVPVLRRHSGGGAVVIGPGAINYSFFFPYALLPGSETIQGATRAALEPIIRTLAAWGLSAQLAGLSDLAVTGADGTLRKIAGNSQARKKNSVVVHGTLLADPDWAAIEALLRFPSSTPDYRAGRSHREFLTSLRDHGAPVSLEEFAGAFAVQLPPDTIRLAAPDASLLARARALAAEKYGLDAWNLRR
jgi:lipoate-protein ligase A